MDIAEHEPIAINHDLFALAYGRAPTMAEAETLRLALVSRPPQAALRLMVSLFDRNFYQTPVYVRAGPADLKQIEVGSFKLIVDQSDFGVSMHISEDESYEPHLMNFMRSTIKPGMAVVDIGANIGLFSMFAASLGASVTSFEPNSENCRLLLMSAAANGFENRINLRPLALSSSEGYTCFSTFVGSNGGILPTKTETLSNPNCMVVPTARLDDLSLGKIDLIKVDVEGAEYHVLRGAEQTIRRFKPIITTEFSFEMLDRVSGVDGVEFLRWITNLGYEGALLGRNGVTGPLGDLSTFRDRWGDNPVRIEDIAFLPKQKSPFFRRLLRLFRAP